VTSGWPAPLRLDRAAGAATLYTLLAVLFTWPLVTDLTRSVAWDHGDPLLVSWIVGWSASRVLQALGGNLAALQEIWHANIFHPEPLTLAYSELLLAQSSQILPVYGLTGNLLLSYNLLFLSTYVLSGLGMYLFVRELTGDWRAAFVAGVIYGFLPYRVNQGPHLQVLSSQWLPFALYGFRRYFSTRRLRSLVGAAVALVAQNLSCGYYLVFFSLFVPPYVLYEMVTRRLLWERRVWRDLALAGAAVGAITIASMYPYFALRDIHPLRRSMDEAAFYAADARAYVTAHGMLNVWGPYLQVMPRPEGDLFPGFLSVLLAGLALASDAWRHWGTSRRAPRSGGAGRLEIVRLATTIVATSIATLSAVALALAVAGFGPRLSLGAAGVGIGNASRLLTQVLLAAAVALLCSPRARRWAREAIGSPVAWFALFALAAFVLSLGPEPRSNGRALKGLALYPYFYEYVPGFDALRVPARFGMAVMAFLAVLAGFGAQRVIAASRRATLVAVALAGVVVAESIAVPLPVSLPIGSGAGYATPPRQLPTGARPSPLNSYLAELDSDAALIVFPFGDLTWDVRYTYESTLHWKPLVNGYSGWAPPWYARVGPVLRRPLEHPDIAWKLVMQSAATYAVVRRDAYHERGEMVAVSRWLESHGARPVAEFPQAVVLALPSRD
jgi:hypothetical protein